MSAPLQAALAALIAVAAMAVAARPPSTPYNNYVLLADAIIHGHAWIDWPGPSIDALQYNGKYYVIEAPLPALLLLPAVAIFGKAANQTILAWILAAIAIGTAWLLCRRLGANTIATAFLVLFLFAGTDLFFCSAFGDVWFLAHTSAVCFTLLALYELTGRKRGWLVALWAVCAFESRFALVVVLPVYAWLLWRSDRRAVRSFLLLLVPVALAWVGYNELRWGTIHDIGYTTWFHRDVQAGEPYGSPFQLKFLPMQLYSFFVLPPDVGRGYPYLAPSLIGTALTWTSPALVLAFLARRPVPLVGAMWAATFLAAAPSFVYYVNGVSQFGMRHALDFEPFLFVLMILAATPKLPVWSAALCLYSACVGVWGTWFWDTFYR